MDNVKIKRIGIKAAAIVYMTALTVFLSHYVSKIYEEDWWVDNDKTTITAFISVAMLTTLVYLGVIEKKLLKFIGAYHFVLIGTVICSLMELKYMPFMLIPMVISAVFNTQAGMVTAVSVGVTLMLGMGEFPLYTFSGAMVVISILGCLSIGTFEKMYKNITGMAGYIGAELIFLIFFRHYCTGYGMEYEETSFIVIMMVVAIASMVLGNVVRIIADMFLRKKTPLMVLNKITAEDAPALQYMKNKSASLYYHSTEVAEMSRLAAKRIGANYQLAYAGGLYHDLGKTIGNEYIKEGLKLADKFGLPKDVKTIMVEHSVKSRLPKSKEAAIVMLSDTVVSAIEYVKGNMDKKDISERTIMENSLNKRVNTGTLRKSGLTMEEYEIIKEALISIKENQ